MMPVITIQGITLEAFLEAQEQLTRRIVKEEIAAFNSKADQEKLLTAKEVCKLLNITKPTLQRWSKSSRVQKLQIAGRVYWREADIRAALSSSNKFKPNPSPLNSSTYDRK